MLIDAHTHIFPHQIAERALVNMTKKIEENYESYHLSFQPRADGTVEGLLASMADSGCTHSIICPIVTSEKSTKSINDFSMAQKSEKITPFASLYPLQDRWEEVLDGIAEQGFKGIKLHPEYQLFEIDCPRSVELVRRAESLGLAVVFHAGKDPGYPPPEKCSPERLANLLDRVDGSRLIAAHMGGWLEWENVKKYLADSPIYFDTACVFDIIDPELCVELMRSHGTDKILFASDYPWQTSGDALAFIESLGLEEKEREQIYWRNAVSLLQIDG